MKAIRVTQFGGPEVLQIQSIDTPTCGEGEVLVRISAAGVNPVETYIRAGAYATLPQLPYTPGGDAAGTVEAVGAGVTSLAVGDRVYTGSGVGGGAYAEAGVFQASTVHKLPKQASFAQGAAIGVPYGTAYRALIQKAEAKAGETVLIHGASGAVGTAAVQIAAAAGMTVIGTASTERGRQLVLEQGAACVVDHSASGYLEEITAFTGGAGPDVIIEMLANVNLQSDLQIVARFGRVIVVGNRGPIEIDARLTMGKDAQVRGMALPNASTREKREIYSALSAGLANGTLRPIIGKEFNLEEAAEAHVAVMESGAFGKIVLNC